MTDEAPVATNPSYRLDGAVAMITLDDGKANALGHDVIDGLHRHLDRAAGEARAVVIAGRPGKFSAGFDLAVMTESVASMRELVEAGAELLVRLYGYELPTVVACDGHALAAGALILLAADTRLGSGDTPSKIGLNEVAIGMPLPVFAVELARQRLLSPRLFEEATMQARIFDPAGAVDAGYLDRTVPSASLLDEALAEARRLGDLRWGAYGRTKRNARQPTIDHIRRTLADDMAAITGPDPTS